MPAVKGPISFVVKVNSPPHKAVVAVISVGEWVMTFTNESFWQPVANKTNVAIAKMAVKFRVVFITL